jgi:hypothetical protein
MITIMLIVQATGHIAIFKNCTDRVINCDCNHVYRPLTDHNLKTKMFYFILFSTKVNFKNKEWRTPLQLAEEDNDPETIQLLAEKGATSPESLDN